MTGDHFVGLTNKVDHIEKWRRILDRRVGTIKNEVTPDPDAATPQQVIGGRT